MPNQVNGKGAMKFYLIALAVLILDQLTKYYFNSTFELHETVDVIPPVLNWTLAYNYGAAFSFLANAGGWQKYFFAVLGLAVSIFIISYLRQIPKNAKILSWGLALVLGGTLLFLEMVRQMFIDVHRLRTGCYDDAERQG